jgi:hypothetical protein
MSFSFTARTLGNVAFDTEPFIELIACLKTCTGRRD